MRPHVFAIACLGLLAFSECANAQICRPVEQRSGSAVGCWIIAHQPLGPFAQSHTFWHLDTYPTLAAAEQAKGPHGTVVKSLDRYGCFRSRTGIGVHRPAANTSPKSARL